MYYIDAADITIDADRLPKLLGKDCCKSWVEALLGACVLQGERGIDARAHCAREIEPRHIAATQQLAPLLPVQISNLLKREKPGEWGLCVLGDGSGRFAAVLHWQCAIIGTRDEIVRVLSFGINRVHH